MSDQTDDALPPPGLAARARLWDRLTELAALAIPVLTELVQQAEDERAEAAERRAHMEARRAR